MAVVYSVATSDPYSFFYDETENNDSARCTTITGGTGRSNHSALGYNAKNGGIPTVLGINVALWAVMIVVFCFVRRWAWNYGRLGLMQKQRWATGLYRPVRTNVTTDGDESEVRVDGEDGYFRWIWTTLMLSHQSIATVCGQDAGYYMSFLRHLIFLQTVIAVLSTAVVLPANYSGKLVTDGFARTTVTNLAKDSNVYWLHNVFSVLYMVIVIFVMSLFARQLRKKQQGESGHTVMITQVPHSLSAEDLQAHLEEAYGDVVDVQFAHDVSELSKLNKMRIKASRSLAKHREMSESSGTPSTIRIGACNDRLPMFCCGKEVDAETHYQDQVQSLTDMCLSCQAQAMNNRIEIAFVTFADSAVAERVKVDYRLGKKPRSSPLSAQVRSKQWSLELAPLPINLKWENLSTGTFLWWARFVLLNAFLCTFLFFWTTPVVIIGSLNKWKLPGISDGTTHSEFVTIWLPTVLLWIVTAVLPVAVSYTSYFENHWTKSDLEHYIMRKTFLFLLLMALVLPALGLASLDSFFTNLHTKESVFKQLECIFLPNSGGFFISYVTFCAFIGTGIELLRIPQLLSYFLALARAKSRQEKARAKKVAAGQFQFGVEYAWVITIFGMSLVFSITCPLIAVFGLCYLLLKYFIDKYNLYFALGRAHRVVKINVHHTAVNFVVLCALLLQLTDLFFSLLRLRQLNDAHTIFALVMFVLSLTYVTASMLFGQLAYLTPFRQSLDLRNDEHTCLPKGSYVAPVLQENFESNDTSTNVLSDEDDDESEEEEAAAGKDAENTSTDGLLPTRAKSSSQQQQQPASYQTFE